MQINRSQADFPLASASVKTILLLLISLFAPAFLLFSCGGTPSGDASTSLVGQIVAAIEGDVPDEYQPENAILVLPQQPAPGEPIRVVVTGGRSIRKARLIVRGPSGNLESLKTQSGAELPCWRIDDFAAVAPGSYTASLLVDDQEVANTPFEVTPRKPLSTQGAIWTTARGWDSRWETLYSAWINALFAGCDEQASWAALHEVTQNKERNFLYNSLSLGEDDPQSKSHVIMQPDCADNPFFLRAYFAWKLGLPFGYHICDRGYVGRHPQTGQWITNETPTSNPNPVLAFNAFIRNIMNGVHSGTARTALDNENADYYPVTLDSKGLRPGTVFADPYGHTLILVSRLPQTDDHPGLLLAVDAQPDKTVAVKRFWKGNFLFNTSEVVGEPGFKAFRPIGFENGKRTLVSNVELTGASGYAPFSIKQRGMSQDSFYLAMERVINPQPLDPEAALMDLINALHEQLMVRVKSVANGEAYMQSHPGAVISMPSSANAIFQSGGQWEDFSTPNRDLRLLIAMDAVVGFPGRVAGAPHDFKGTQNTSPEEIKAQLQTLLDKKVAELTITYFRSDGSSQVLTLAELLNRREAFEVAYNPNDGAEIRWGAPLGSAERSTCRRQAPANQKNTMQTVRKWFNKRLHPPT